MKNNLLILALLLWTSGKGFSKIVTNPSKEDGVILSAIPKARLVRGPYLQVATDSSLVIRWRTNLAVNSVVNYGHNPDHLSLKVTDRKPVINHIVKISGLKADTRYYYSICYYDQTYKLERKLQGDSENYFYTLPLSGKIGDYRIGLFGDPGDLSTLQKQVHDQFLKYLGDKRLNAWIVLGDIAYSHGLDAEYQAKFFNPYEDMLKKYPLFPLPGNHDYHDDIKTYIYLPHKYIEYFQNFSVPTNGQSGGVPSHNKAYYSFDMGNAHFLCLDSFGAQDSTFLRDSSGIQMQWVKKDLADAKKRKMEWIIVCTHFPPYSMGSHNSDNQFRLYKIRQYVLPIVDRYGVDLMICGHSHDYERSKMMYGYYGKAADFKPGKDDLSQSSGKYNGSPNSCPYVKGSDDRGTVYVVDGSASVLAKVQATWPMKAMPFHDSAYGGALLLEIRGNRIDLKRIRQDGVIADQFTMMKNIREDSVIYLKKPQNITLRAPYIGEYTWNNGQHTQSIHIKPKKGINVFTVHDQYNCLRDIIKVIVSKRKLYSNLKE